MNSKEIFQQHHETAQLLSDMFNHKGAIVIHACSLKYVILPGSVHYDQVKHLISMFGCDHIAHKYSAELNICSTTQQTETGRVSS